MVTVGGREEEGETEGGGGATGGICTNPPKLCGVGFWSGGLLTIDAAGAV